MSRRNSDKAVDLDVHPDSRDRALFEELEPRLLYSAGIEAVLFDTAWTPVGAPLQQVHTGFADPAVGLTTVSAADVRHELVFVDASTPDYQQLVEDLLAQRSDGVRIDVIVIDQAEDGIEQIDTALLAFDNLDAVHFISHGSNNGLQLGGSWLSNESLEDYRSTIAGWREVLSDDADLLFYGCDLAAGDEGRALIAALGELTGADIAASTDWTGADALGGDWHLEYASGNIEASIAVSAKAQTSWQGVLNTAPTLDSSLANLWLSTRDDMSGSAAPGLTSWTEGEVLRFGGPGFGLGPGTTAGTFAADAFNLDDFGDGNTDIDAIHYVTTNITVGSGGDSFDLLAGDVLLSTQADENLASTNSLSVNKRDVFVFRPDAPGDYSSGTFYLLLDEPLGADLDAMTLVEQDTMVGGTLLQAGTFLLGYGNKEIHHYTADTVGEGTTSGTLSLLVEGPDIGIDQNIVGLDLVENTITMGGVTLNAGQILVTLENEDSAVGSGPIATERRDIIALTITQTGTNTLGDATMLFDGSDVGLTDNKEDLDALALVPTPRLDPILEDLPALLNEGTLVSDLLADVYSDVNGDPPGMAVTGVDDTNGTWEYSLDGGTTWLAFGAVTDGAAIVLSATDRVRFDPGLDFNGTAEFTFRAWDGTDASTAGDTVDSSVNGGATAFSTDSATGRIEVIAQNEVNDAPINIVPNQQVVSEGTPLVFSSANGNRVYIADFDDLGGSMLVTLTVDYGRLTLSGVSGLNFSAGDGTDDATMTFTGTVSAINTALQGMTFTPAHNYVGLATLSITTDDQGNSGTGGPLEDSDSFYVLVEGDAVNDAPVSDVPGTQYSGVDVPITFGPAFGNTIWAIDDAGSGLVQLTLTATNGTFSLNLPPAPTEQQVNTYTTEEQLAPSVAVAPSGAYVVAWQSRNQDGGGEGIFAQLYDASGQQVGTEFQVNTESSDHQITPVAAMDADGNFVIAWASNNQDGQGSGIYAQRYAADGTLLGGEFLVNTTTANDQFDPAIAMADDGRFVIAWVDGSLDGSGDGVFARLFNADGSAATGEFGVSVVTSDHQVAPSVAMDVDGNFVVAWQSKGQDGDGEGIFARRFDSTGTALDVTDIAVNTQTVKHQTVPSVAMDASGNFVVAWQTEQHDGDGMGIFSRRFDSAGAALDVADVQVTTYTTKNQMAPSVSSNANGEFVIAWQSQDQDGSGEGVYAQWYDSTGAAVGGEVLMNVTTADDQTAPAVGIDASGDYVAVWASKNQDGDKNGIYATTQWRGDAYEFVSGDGINDTLVQLTGTVEHLNRLMAGLTFTPTLGFNGTATLQVDIDDQGNTGTGGPLSDSATVYMVFNDAPVLDNSGNMSLTAIDEDVSDVANVGTLVSDIVASAGGDRITDPNGPAFEGLAVIGVDDTNGTWQYSTDGGATWLDFGAVAASSATLLTATANDRIRFVPNANYFGSVPAGITFRAWDTTDNRPSGETGVDVTVNGGYTPFSSATETASIVVNAVNDLPTGANNTVVTLEDTAYVFTVADFGFGDIDGDSLAQVQITSLEGFGSLQLSGIDVVLNQVISVADITAGNLTFTPAANDNGTGYDSFDFRVHDGTAYSAASYTMTVDVTAVNDLPTAANNTVSALEDTPYVLTVADFGFNDVDGDSLTQLQITSLESVGSLRLSGVDVVLNQVISVADITAGNLTFAPVANENGAGYDSFDFRVHDGTGYSAASYTMTVDVTAVNDLPTGANNTVVTLEDTAYVFTVADFGFGDIDGDSLTQVQITSLESVGSLRLSGVDVVLNQVISVADITAGNLTFTPAANDNGAGYDSFGFLVNDGTAYSATGYTMTVDVTAVNDLPAGANNTVVTLEDTSYTFTLADFGYSDVEGDSFTQIQVTSLESSGSLQLSGVDVVLNQVISVADITAGNLTFTPAANDNGAGYDSFDFRVHDGSGYSASAYTMTVDVTAVNDPPTAASNTVSTLEDTAYVFTVADFGFSDIDGDSLTQVQITSLEGVGSLRLSGIDVVLNQVISVADITAGNLTFTPAANDNGASYDSFDFRVNDGAAYSASAYTMTVDVTAVNDLPTAANNTVVTLEDTAYVFTAADFGFSDIDGDSLTQVQITSLESAGSLQLSGVDVVLNQVISVADITAGNLTFTPAADDNGASYDNFDFRVHDGTGYSASSYTMTVDVTAVNDLPTAADNTVVTLEDTAYVFTVADFGFSDIDGDSLTQVQITSLEGVGSLQLSGVDVLLNQVISVADITAGNLTFTPAANDNGASYDSFDFRVNDGTGYSVSAYTMTVDVTAVNDLPTAANNTVSTLEDTAYAFTIADFGFSDIDGDSLTQVQITSLESVGSLQLSGVDVVLNQVISVADITAGNLTFTPAANDNGAGYDSFDFRVNDGTGYSVSGYTMTVDVTAVNDLPTAANNTVVTLEDTAYVFTVADFGFSDIDGDSLTQVQITSLEGVGSLQLSGVDVLLNQVISVADITAGNLTFTPAANGNGAGYDSFDFRVNDGTGYSVSAYTMTVDVTAVNDLPTAASNTVSTLEDTTYVFTVADFGFSDIDGDSLTQVQITSLESVGSLQLSGVDVVLNQVITVADITAGNLTFAPAADDNGASYDSFDFRVNDGTAYSASSYTMTVDVTAVNDLPTAANNTVSTLEDTAYVFTIADFGFSDIDGDSLTQIQITSLESVGSLQLSGVDVLLNQVISAADITAGNLTFTPAADDNGASYDNFDFRVHDGTGYSASSYTMTVDVTAVNDLPTAADNTVVTLEDTAYVFTVADFGFSDIDGDSLTQIQVTSLESVGSLQLSGVDVVLNQVISVADITAGNLTFTPAADDNGASYDSFDFRVNDGTAYSAASYTMTVDVTAINDVPTAADNAVVTLEDTAYVFTVSDFGFSDIDGDSLTQVQITGLESVGSLQLSGVDVVLNQVISVADITAGNLTFTPAADDNSASYDSFDFRVNDGTSYSAASYTMTVDVTAVNDLPTAANNTVVTLEDTAYVFTVSDFGFSDIDGDSLAQVQITSLESLGSLQLSGVDVALNQVISVADITAGNLTFTPAANDNGASYDSFDFRVDDGTGYSAASYTMTVDVTAVNDLPTGADNTVVTAEDTPYVFHVADFGFSDIDGDALTQVQITSLESVGSLQLSGVDVVLNQVISVADITAGNLTFTPALNDNGVNYDSFDFRVNDGTGYSASTYTITVDVTGVNNLPTGANNTVVTAEDTAYVFTVADFGFSDVDGDTLNQIQVTSLESVGSLQLSGVNVVLNQVISAADITAGNLTFTPAADDNGAGYDSFDFRVQDGITYSASSYTMTVDVTAVNDLPTAANNTVSTLEDTAYVFTVADFGFSDIDGDSLTQVQITSLESVGSLQLSGVDVVLNQVISVADITAGNLTFTPASNDNGAGYDSFDFRVHDGTAYSAASYTMTVDVTAVNDVPTAADNTVVTLEDTAYVFTVTDFGFSDIDGDSLAQIQVTSLESVGSLQLSGVDVALNQVISVADITAGNLTFTPAADDNGASYDSFDFRVNDGTGDSAASYTMTVDVTAVNDLPTGANNTVATAEDTAYVFTVADFGFNDIDGDSLTQVEITSLESAGSLQLSGVDVVLNQVISVADITAGNLTFTPAADDNGAGYDSFDFRVNDGTAYSASSYTMTVDVTAVNDVPTAADNTVLTLEDTAYVFTVADFGFSDIDGDSLTQVQITSLESVGSLQLSGVDVVLNQVISVADITAGNLTFTPAADDNGASYDSFDFRVNDGTADSAASYTMTLDVTAVNDLPTAANNTVVTLEDTAYVFTVADFGFSDIDGDSLAQIQVTGLEAVGTLQVNGIDVVLNQVISVADITAGNLTFTPAADDNGAAYDSFDFRVQDGTAYSAASYTMTVDVTAVNDLPTAANNTVVTLEDTAYVFTVADFGFSDIEGDSFTQIQVTSLEAVGAMQLNGVDVTLNQVISVADITAGNLTFTPAADDNSTSYDSFDFRVNDGTAYSASSYTMTVDVTAVNDVPTAADNTVLTLEDTAYVFTVADFGFSDIDGDSLTQVQITSLESLGSLQLSGVDVVLNQVISVADITAGNLTFTPAANDNGASYDSFDFRVSDGTGYSAASYTITVDVTTVNDLPTAANNTVSTLEDTAYVFTLADFGFSDIDGDSLAQIQVTGLEAVGTLQVNGIDVVLNQMISVADITAGNLTFTPAANDNGPGYDSFDFRVNDGIGYSASVYTMTVDVTAVADLPSAASNTVVALEDTPYVFTVAEFGFSDVDGDGLTQIQVTSLESAGTLQLNGVDVALNQVISVADITAGNLTFTPAADDNGTGYDSFDFRVNDGTGYSASAYTMTVDVTPANDLPTAADNTVTTLEDTAYVFTVADFGFSDIDGDTLAQVQVTSLESVGALQLNGVDVALNQVITVADITAGNLTFTPAANDNGAAYDSFSFRVHDGTTASASSYTMTVDVLAENDPPVGFDNTVSTLEDADYIFSVADFAFSDIDGGALNQVQLMSLPVAGSLQLSGVDVVANQVISIADIVAGNLTFSPAPDANGAGYDSFDFRVHDGAAYSSAAYTMTVDVVPANDLPAAADNTISTLEDTDYIFNVDDFGFSDIDGDTLSAVRITLLPTAGALQLSGVDVELNQLISVSDISAGNLVFSPAPGESGAAYDRFRFTVSDGIVASAASYEMTIDVAEFDVEPVAAPDFLQTDEDTPLGVGIADLTGNDTVVEGSSITIASVGEPQHGNLVLNEDGSYTYTPDVDFSGTDTFVYTIADALGRTAQAMVTIEVAAVNDAPEGGPDDVLARAGTPLSIDVLALLSNDTDVDSSTLQITAVSSPVFGGIVDNGDGTLSYLPLDGFVGSDSFTYTVSDDAGASDTVTVTVAINANQDVVEDVAPGNEPATPDNAEEAREQPEAAAEESQPDAEDNGDDSATPIPAGALQLPGDLSLRVELAEVQDGRTGSTLDARADSALLMRRDARISVALKPEVIADSLDASVRMIRNVIAPMSSNPVLLEALDMLMRDVDESAEAEQGVQRLIVGTVKSGSSAALIAALYWVARGGAVAAAMFSSLPVWMRFDPVPVLAAAKKQRKKEEAGDLEFERQQAASEAHETPPPETPR